MEKTTSMKRKKLLPFFVFIALISISCQEKEAKKQLPKKDIAKKKTLPIPKPKKQEISYSFELSKAQEITGIEISLQPFGENQYKVICDTTFFKLEISNSKSESYTISFQKEKQLQYIDLNEKQATKSLFFRSWKTVGNLEKSKNVTYYIRSIQDSSFVNMKALNQDFLFDIRYATSNNFTKAVIYDCPTCLLRWEVAKAMLKAAKKLEKSHYKFLFFDCYRPIDGQKRLWAKVPNPTYVANPYTKGSIHSRGCAVDLSIADENNRPLDMGTDFDFFGRKARPAFTNVPENVLKNRLLLSKTLAEVGFKPITSEWWHFNFRGSWKYPLSNTPFQCD